MLIFFGWPVDPATTTHVLKNSNQTLGRSKFQGVQYFTPITHPSRCHPKGSRIQRAHRVLNACLKCRLKLFIVFKFAYYVGHALSTRDPHANDNVALNRGETVAKSAIFLKSFESWVIIINKSSFVKKRLRSSYLACVWVVWQSKTTTTPLNAINRVLGPGQWQPHFLHELPNERFKKSLTPAVGRGRLLLTNNDNDFLFPSRRFY